MDSDRVKMSMMPTMHFEQTITRALDGKLSAGWTGSVSEESEYTDSDSFSLERPLWSSDLACGSVEDATFWDSSTSAIAGSSIFPTYMILERTNWTDGLTMRS